MKKKNLENNNERKLKLKLLSKKKCDSIMIDKVKYILGVPTCHDTVIINEGEDITPYLNQNYYISKTKALLISGVTESKLCNIDCIRGLEIWYLYKFDDVIAISDC